LKNLAIVFSTFHIPEKDERYNKDRQDEYATCYQHLLRVIPKSFDVVFVDNSIEDVAQLQSQKLLSSIVGQKVLLTTQNFGLKNKGVGELAMLVQATQYLNLNDYETICYCTGRKIFTCPYPFEKAIETDKKATVSNPDFQFLDGRFRKVAQGMYNDMFFAMKRETLIDFIKYTSPRLPDLEKYMINSESNLFSFVQEKQVPVQVLEFLGIVRNELGVQDPYYSFENYHIC